MPGQAEGARTRAGTWAPTAEEADLIEMIADKDAEWEASLAGKDAWINRPAQPPGLLRSGAASAPGAATQSSQAPCMFRHISVWEALAN